MRVRRLFRSVSTFLTQLCGALVKAVATSLVLVILLVSLMQYMGVPVPSAYELLGGLARLAHIFS